MGYNFYQKFPIMKAMEAERLVIRYTKLSQGWRNEQASRKALGLPYAKVNPYGGEGYYKATKAAGLSFRKKDVLYDYRRASAIELSKSLTAKGKADSWFENVLERIRKEKGITQKEALGIWKEMQRKQEELEEFTGEEEGWWEVYECLW